MASTDTEINNGLSSLVRDLPLDTTLTAATSTSVNASIGVSDGGHNNQSKTSDAASSGHGDAETSQGAAMVPGSPINTYNLHYVREPEEVKPVIGDSSGLLTSEPVRVTFQDTSIVYFVQKEVMRRLLGQEAAYLQPNDQGEIHLGAYNPGAVQTLIRVLFALNPQESDLGLSSLSLYEVLKLYATATKLGPHQWIRMACLAELETRPVDLTELIAEFRVLYNNGDADRDARDTFKCSIERELNRGWPVDYLSRFLSDVSRFGGDLAADLVEAVVLKCSLENHDNHTVAHAATDATNVASPWFTNTEAGDRAASMAGDMNDSSGSHWLENQDDNWHQEQEQQQQQEQQQEQQHLLHPYHQHDVGLSEGWGHPIHTPHTSHATDQGESFHGQVDVSSYGNNDHHSKPMSQLPADHPHDPSSFQPPPSNFPPWWSADLERVHQKAAPLVDLPFTQVGTDSVVAPVNQNHPAFSYPMSPQPATTFAQLLAADEDATGKGQTQAQTWARARAQSHAEAQNSSNRGGDDNYSHLISIGNGMMHPKSPGTIYGLAGRQMIATRNSGYDCSLFFVAGDIITNVIPVAPAPYPHTQNWRVGTGGIVQFMQGVCRGRAGQFPASYVRELNADLPSVFTGRRLGSPFQVNAMPTKEAKAATKAAAAAAAARTKAGVQAAADQSVGMGNKQTATAGAGAAGAAGELTCGNWGCGDEQCKDCRGDEIEIGRRRVQRATTTGQELGW